MKKIFITGICGFVGSSLASFFIKKNYKVFGADNLSRNGSKKNVSKLRKMGIQIFIGNLCNKNFINKILNKKNNFDTIIHCAAYTSVLDGVNTITEKELYENNILSTISSLDITKKFRSNYVYISSSRIYNIETLNSLKLKFLEKYIPIKNNEPGLGNVGVKENFSTMPPVSIYGSSKIISENLIQEYCFLNKLPFVINRCGLLTGSGQLYKKDQGIVSFWINSWKKNKKLNYIGFNGLGYQTRDCLHPNDLGELIRLQLKKINKLKDNNKIYNVSGGIESSFSLKELSNWCKKNIYPRKIKSNKKTRKFDVKWLVLDNSKAKRQFGWKIKYKKNQIFKDILNEND